MHLQKRTQVDIMQKIQQNPYIKKFLPGFFHELMNDRELQRFA